MSAVTAKTVTEQLNRAKGYFHRHESEKALMGAAGAFKLYLQAGVVGRDAMQLQLGLTEMAQLVNRMEEVKRFLPDGIPYAKGKEKQFLVALATVIKKYAEEKAKEDREATRARKLKIDRLLSKGLRMLQAKKPHEALEAFDAAVELYVDEDKLFCMVGERLVENGFPKEAQRYLERAVKTIGDDAGAVSALITARMATGEKAKAMELAPRLEELAPDKPDSLALAAEAYARGGDKARAAAAAKQALGLNPRHARSKKILKAVG